MKTVDIERYEWGISCVPEDGARISRLSCAGHDLLNRAPRAFSPPDRDYGAYETRPVYGYDDCFPSVDPCTSPDGKPVPDHGSLCWIPWDVVLEDDCLVCSVEPDWPRVAFRRTLCLSSKAIQWKFDVRNKDTKPISAMHVMHPMMPPDRIAGIQLPDADSVYDEIAGAIMDLQSDGASVWEYLSGVPDGSASMICLRDISSGCFNVNFEEGFSLRVEFPVELFPTLGIWYNRGGHPDQPGCRRREVGVEPIPGSCSDLAKSVNDGQCLEIDAGKAITWSIYWTIT